MMKDVMLDLETLGTTPGCVVLSIGAIFFGVGCISTNTFSVKIQIEPQLAQGMHVAGDAIEWWLRQSDGARSAVSDPDGKIHPETAVRAFHNWFNMNAGERIWGHGAAFDVPVIEDLFNTFGVKQPWNYRASRDTRTLFDIAGKKMGDFGTENLVAHDALSDAIYQAKETAACLAFVKSKMTS